MTQLTRTRRALLSVWTALLVLVSGLALHVPVASADAPQQFGGRFPVVCGYPNDGRYSSLDWTASLTGSTLTVEVPRMPRQASWFPDFDEVTPQISVDVNGVRHTLTGTAAIEAEDEGRPLVGDRALSADIGTTDVETVSFVSLVFEVWGDTEIFRCVEDEFGWTGTLAGTVSVPEGFDVTQVTVTAESTTRPGDTTAHPDADGRWTMEVPGGEHVLSYSSSESGLLRTFHPETPDREDSERVEVPRDGLVSGLTGKLLSLGQITVPVVSQVPGERVTVSLERRYSSWWGRVGAPQFTTTDGPLVFGELVPGEYRAVAQSPTQYTVRSPAVQLAAGEHATLSTLALGTGGRLAVTAATLPGNQLLNTEIEIHDLVTGELVSNIHVDAGGSATSGPLAPGEYHLRVDLSGSERSKTFWYSAGGDDRTPVTVRTGESTAVAVTEPAPASLSGRVLNAEGPVVGATVELHDPQDPHAWPEATETDAQGRYEFNDLELGARLIRADAPGQTSSWFGGDDRATATPVSIRAGSDASGKDIELGSISLSGRVVNSQGKGLKGVSLTLQERELSWGGDGYRTAETGADGEFVFAGLERVEHFLSVWDPDGRTGAYDNGSGDDETSNVVDLSSGDVDVEIRMKPAEGSGMVSGTFALPEGLESHGREQIRIWKLVGGEYEQVGETYPGYDRTPFALTLEAGTYKFEGLSTRPYIGSTWYGGTTLEDATPVEVEDGAEIDGITLSMKLTGTISTGASLWTKEVSRSVIEALREDPDGEWRVAGSVNAVYGYSQGFQLAGLEPGSYVVRLRSLDNAHPTQYSGGSATLENARRYEVKRGVTTYASDMAGNQERSTASGHVSREDGAPVDGLVATIERQSNGEWYHYMTIPLDKDGRWGTTIIPLGNVRLVVRDPEGRYLTRATEFTSEALEITENVDVSVPLGGSITGKITGVADPEDRLRVKAVQGTTQVETSVKADGTYRLQGLEAGAHQVMVIDTDEELPTRGANGSASPDGSPVQVTLGETRSGVDVEMGPGATLHGEVDLAAGLKPSDVHARLAVHHGDDSSEMGSVTLGADGSWAFEGLDPGVYSVSLESADAVTPRVVALAEIAVGVNDVRVADDVTMTKASTISGTISGPGQDHSRYLVVIRGAEDEKAVAVAADGSYRSSGLPAGDYDVLVTDRNNELPSRDLSGLRSSAGTTVTLAAGEQLSGQDVLMGVGASFSGPVDLVGGLAPADVQVTLERAVVDEGTTTWVEASSKTLASDSTWSFDGIEPGTYRVVLSSTEGRFASRTAVTSTKVTLLDTITSPSVTLTGRGQISGTATGPDGVDLARFTVQAVDLSGEEVAGQVNLTSDGSWAIPRLEAGTYGLHFEDTRGEIPDSFLGWIDDLHASTRITLAAGQSVTGLEHDVDVRGRLAGQLVLPATSDHESVEVEVHRWNVDGGGDRTLGAKVTFGVNSNGVWKSPALAAGQYSVKYTSTDPDLADRWQGGATKGAAAQVHDVRDFHVVKGIDHTMVVAGSITGRVSLPGVIDPTTIEVRAERWDATPAAPTPQGKSAASRPTAASDGTWVPAGTARVQADGTYRVRGLEAGTHRLSFVDTAGVMETVRDETSLDVALGATATVPATTMRGFGSLVGAVTVPAGVDPTLVDVDLYTQTDGAWKVMATTKADAAGAFVFADLPVGLYRVGFGTAGGALVAEFHEDATAVTTARDVRVDGREPAVVTANLAAVPLPAPTPSEAPVPSPSAGPSTEPSAGPSASPSAKPSGKPSGKPSSKPSAKVIPLKKAPKVSGKARSGRTLKTTRGTWGAKGVKVTFQWQSKKPKKKVVTIKKAKKSSLKLTRKLRGSKVRVVVRVTAPGFKARTHTSKWSKKVA